MNRTAEAAFQVKVALWLYAALVVLLTAVSWTVYWRYPAADRRPLFTESDQFHDLTNYVEKTAYLYHRSEVLGGEGYIFNYPPAAAFVYHAFLFSWPHHPVRLYLAFLALCTLGLSVAAWRACAGPLAIRVAAGCAILTTALLGFPLWFTADRANLEGVAWAFAAVGLCFLLRGRYRTGAVLIGLAACIKPFPILFLLLLVRRAKYKDALFGVVAAGAVSLTALIYLGPNPWRAYRDLESGVDSYAAVYVENIGYVDQLRFQHSLLDGMKSAALVVGARSIHPTRINQEVDELRLDPEGWHVAHTLAHVYPFIAIVGFLSLTLVFYNSPMLNQLTALSIAVCVFPLAAPDYTLLHMYVPFGAMMVFLVRDVVSGKVTLPHKSILPLALIYAGLFAPLTPLRVFAGDAKLILLLGLLVFVARTPMRSEYFDGDGSAISGGAVAQVPAVNPAS